MAKIKIMQLLCPKRHCITALAFDPATTTEEAAQTLLKGFSKAFNQWCGICGSGVLRFETGTTKFDTLAEASSALIVEEKKNAAAREILGGMRRSARNN